MKRRTAVALVALGVVLSVAVPVAAGVISGGKELSGQSTASFDKANGPNVTMATAFNWTTTNPWQTSNQITLQPHVNFSSAGDSAVRVTSLHGTWTNTTELDVDGAALTVNTSDKQLVTVGGDAAAFNFTEMAVDDGSADFSYRGQSGSTTVEISGLPANTKVAAIEAGSTDVLAVESTDATGTVSYSLPNSKHVVRLQTTSGGPSIDDSSLSPDTTSETVSDTDSITLSADVTDPDFPDDSVTVSFFVEGQQVGQETLTSSGTASVTISRSTAGEADWYAEATDAYGQTDQSATAQFAVPDTLYIYNESDPDQLVNAPAEVDVQFFAEDGSVYSRSTSDGTINLTGLPADEDFVVSASASNYLDRRIYVESLLEQQRIYLLPENATTANVVYELDDKADQFTPTSETTLFVEKPLNVSGSTSYQVIVSDQFSATNEVPVTLENGQRYRLRIEGPDGQTRVLGAYRAAGDDRAVLTVGQVSFDGTEAATTAFNARVTEVNGQQVVQVTYLDPTNSTTDLSIEIVNETSGATVRPNTTATGEWGRYVETIPISTSLDDSTWRIEYHAERDGQPDAGGTSYVGKVPDLGDFGTDPAILSALGYVIIIATLGLTAISHPRFCGIPTTAVATALTMLGIVAIHPLLLSGSGVVSLLFAAGGSR